MIKVFGALALSAVTATVAASPALADAITINSTSVPNNTAVEITASSPAPTVSEGGLAGEISANITDTTTNITSQMNVWCADIKDTLSTPASYTLTTLSSMIGQANYTTLDATKVNQVNALLNAVTLGLVSATNATTSAALQIAIWDVIYESGDSSYNVTSGNFYVSSYGGDNISSSVNNSERIDVTVDFAVLQ